jgi:hypothetical protein
MLFADLVILRAVRHWERPSWLGRDKSVGAAGRGALRAGAGIVVVVVVVADVWTAADIMAFVLFEREELEGSRAKDSPTADEPATLALAINCVTAMGQSWRYDDGELFEVRQTGHRRSRMQSSGATSHIKTTQGQRICTPMGREKQKQ